MIVGASCAHDPSAEAKRQRLLERGRPRGLPRHEHVPRRLRVLQGGLRRGVLKTHRAPLGSFTHPTAELYAKRPAPPIKNLLAHLLQPGGSIYDPNPSRGGGRGTPPRRGSVLVRVVAGREGRRLRPRAAARLRGEEGDEGEGEGDDVRVVVEGGVRRGASRRGPRGVPERREGVLGALGPRRRGREAALRLEEAPLDVEEAEGDARRPGRVLARVRREAVVAPARTRNASRDSFRTKLLKFGRLSRRGGRAWRGGGRARRRCPAGSTTRG